MFPSLSSALPDADIVPALENALRTAETRFRTQADAIPQLLWATDPDGNHLYYNRRWYEYTGQTLEESLGFGFALALHPNDKERTLERWRQAWEGGADYEIEYRFRRHDGVYRWFVGRAEPIRDAETGSIVQWIGTCTDIDDLRRTREELEESRARLQLSTEAAQLGIWDFRAPTGQLIWDERCKALFGLPPDAPVNDAVFRAGLHPEDAERVTALVERALDLASGANGEYEAEFRIRTAQDEERWISAKGRAYFDAEHRYAERFIGTMRDVTQRAQVEAERERLLVEARARAEREALLNQIGDGIRQSLPPEQIESEAIAALGAALYADRCYIVTVNPQRDALTVTRDWHVPEIPSVIGHHRLSDLGLDLDTVFGDGTTVIADDVQHATNFVSERNAAANKKLGIASLLQVPFYEKGRFVGALAVAMATETRRWTETEVMLAETVAGQLRSVLETVRLQQRERNIAEQLQEALQPALPDSVPGLALRSFYRPALEEAEVGGDFIDAATVDKKRAYLCVADLSGKGLAAAQQIGLVKNTMRYALHTSPTLVEAVSSVDHVLSVENLLIGFATLFAGVYDAASHTLTYVNAGQEPGLLWRAATGTVEPLPPTGAVLGGFTAPEGYEEKVVSLSPGDVLALFTDGLTEVGPNRRNMLGMEGVSRLFHDCCQRAPHENAPDSIVKSLIAGVDAYARGGARDDIALLVAQVL